MKHDTEFYIGWQAEAPAGFARMVRRFVWGLCLVVPALAFLLVRFQNGFSTATFEYGTTTELSGIFHRDPVPFLAVSNGAGTSGAGAFQNILLVAEGKLGFDHVAGASGLKNGQEIKISGFLVYHDGKTAIEVHTLQVQNTPPVPTSTYRQYLGQVTLRGEITDPKCMLGVMKPGFGKPHRDCAVRCISGGIPPVLKVANSNGDTEYYLLAGPEGEPLNDCLLDFVADGVQISGRLEQLGDWLVLYADPGAIFRINKGALNAGPMCGGT